MIPDVVKGVTGFLLGDTDVISTFVTRVYGEELPETEAEFMPRSCAVVKEAGGPGSLGTLSVRNIRVDVRSYGESPYEARIGYNALYSALKNMRSHIEDEIKLLSAWEESGPISLRDPDTRWPFVVGSWIIMAREVAIVS